MPPKQVVKEDRMSLTLHTDHKQDACQILIFAPKLWTRCQSKGRNVSGFTTLWWPIYWRESKRKYPKACEEEAIEIQSEFFPLLTRIYYMLFVGSNPIKTQIVPVFFLQKHQDQLRYGIQIQNL